MGIKSLTKLIKIHSPDSIKHIELKELSGKTVAIDISLFIYQSLINIPSKGDKDIGHIIGIYNKTIKYLSYNITPIYIFDGSPPEHKRDLLNIRNKKASDAKLKMKENINNKVEYDKYKKKSIRMNKIHIEDIKLLLKYMGVSYIQMKEGEAEGIASELCRIKYVDYVVTEDMDSLVFGTPYLIRNCIDKSYKAKDMITIFDLNKLLSDLDMTNDEFIELCILCGCDYCENIPKIGIKKAYTIIKQYNGILNYINSTNITLPVNYIDKYTFSKKYFNSYKNIFNNMVPITTSTFNKNLLQSYLVNNNFMNINRFNQSIRKITYNYVSV